jgi:hypothetical protein
MSSGTASASGSNNVAAASPAVYDQVLRALPVLPNVHELLSAPGNDPREVSGKAHMALLLLGQVKAAVIRASPCT